MTSRAFNSSLRISRCTTSKQHNTITISVIDEDSRIAVVELSLTLEQFALAITGVSITEVKGETWLNDERVGKIKINKTVTVEAPKDLVYNRDVYSQWLRDNYELPKGWFSDFYLGSQGSIKSIGSSLESRKVLLTFHIYTYADSSFSSHTTNIHE